RVEGVRPPYDLLVLPVRLERVDLDHDGLVHRVRDDRALALLTASALVLGLLEPDDRLAGSGLGDFLLRTRRSLRPRKPFLLSLLFGRFRWRGSASVRRCCRLCRL